MHGHDLPRHTHVAVARYDPGHDQDVLVQEVLGEGRVGGREVQSRRNPDLRTPGTNLNK